MGSQSAFDVAFDIDAVVGKRAVVGVETKTMRIGRMKRPPKPEALERYTEVTERPGILGARWRDLIVGTGLPQIWLDHLLVLAMLQHRQGGCDGDGSSWRSRRRTPLSHGRQHGM